MLLEKAKETTYITPRGLAKIEAELARLRGERRSEIVERLQDAKVGGDVIDNTEYILVQEELALLDGRIYELDYILRHAEPLLPGEVDGIVRLGSLVVVQQEGAAELESYTLVGPLEADPCAGMISNQSPLGRALLNHTSGDDVEISTPDGPTRFRIVAIG